MSAKSGNFTIGCRCGQVGLTASGAPIMTVVCHCASCQKAGAGFAALPRAPSVFDANGGTPFVMMRKDRVAFGRGEAQLLAYRLSREAKTRRVLARCCNAPMFLEFSGGHWLSLYRDRFGADAPAIEMHVMTGDHQDGAPLTDAVPSYKTHSIGFMWRLLRAWAAMGFRVPALKPIEEA